MNGAELARWGRWVHGARWSVLVASALALLVSIGVIVAGGRLEPPDVPAETESGRARRLMDRDLPGQPPTFSLIFSSATLEARDPAFRAEVEAALAPLRSDPRVARVRTIYDAPGQPPRCPP